MTSPLEVFLRDYAEASGGLWDEIEPQVYDVLWPDSVEPQRLTFDPEALPEHPEAQLLTFGVPLLDELLQAAQAHGQAARVYLDDMNLQPYGLEQQVRRDLTLPEGMRLEPEASRARYVAHAIFWFEATYLGDEKAQSVLSATIDRHYGRLSRHLEPLLAGPRPAEEPRWPLPDASALPLEHAYLLARDRVARTVASEANGQQRERQGRAAREIERMERYFADMGEELETRIAKASTRGEDVAALRQRRGALEREAALRIDELRRKAGVRASLQLRNVLHLKTPRLFLAARLVTTGSKPAQAHNLSLTWDPLTEKTDPLDCPTCQRPTLTLVAGRRGELRCPICVNEQGGRGR